jgi:hypothetical protein
MRNIVAGKRQQNPEFMLLNLFTGLSPDLLIALCTIFFGFIVYSFRLLHSDFREMQKEFITLKSFLEGQKHDVRMNDIRITKLEEQNKTIEAQITDLKLQIAKI